MNKRAIFIFVFIIIFLIIFYLAIRAGSKQEENNLIENNSNIEDEINDIVENETIEISVSDIKTTPNTTLVLKKYYVDCGDTIENSATLPEEMVNLTEEEVKSRYPNWTLEKFSKEEIVLFKSFDSFCGEHYMLIEEDGHISIYMIDEENNKTLKEKTDISVEYLPETDRISLRNGLMIYGKEELNKILEDFES